jgi:hypothetical protein
MRKRWVLIAALCGVYGSIPELNAEGSVRYDFSRYQIILEREPFGKPPPPPPPPRKRAAPAPPPVVTPPFVRSLRMCAITARSSDGKLRVGLIDIKSKPQKTYLLYVGDTTEDGIELVEADFAEEKALLRKGGEEHWIQLGGESTAATARKGGKGLFGGIPQVPFGSAAHRSKARSNTAANRSTTSYAARLKARREAMAKRRQELAKPKLSGGELKSHLQNYQMDLIRKGMPPLPMPLTREMDDQLVKEGVLPPQQ